METHSFTPPQFLSQVQWGKAVLGLPVYTRTEAPFLYDERTHRVVAVHPGQPMCILEAPDMRQYVAPY